MINTVVSLPEELVDRLENRAAGRADRDALVAEAVKIYLDSPPPGDDASDLAIIQARATELNEEARDSLAFQVSW